MLEKTKDNIKWFEFEQLAGFPRIRHAVYPIDCKQDLKNPFVKPKLVHGCKVKEVKIQERPECDAVATNQTALSLVITHADCQAAIIYDPINHAVANVHCGWRGSVQNIYKETVSFMNRIYGSDPANLLVCVSPSLGPDHAEFVNYKQELPEVFWEFQVKPYYFDFWEISKWQLLSCGVLESHIEIAKMCTFEMSSHFYSYRRDKTTKRNQTAVTLL